LTYDYAVLFASIVAAVSESGSITKRMLRLIEYCEAQLPHEDWSRMRQIDYAADSHRLDRWLATSFAEANPSASFRGLWFGIDNPIVRGQSTADIYLCASTKFEPWSLDWAVAAQFYPKSRYLNSKVLTAVYRLAYRSANALGNAAEYPLCLAYGAMVACEALESGRLSGPFANLLGAAAGFDSGDLLFLGSFSDGTFRVMPEAG